MDTSDALHDALVGNTGIRFLLVNLEYNSSGTHHTTLHSRHGKCTEQASQHSIERGQGTLSPRNLTLPNSLNRSAPLAEAQRNNTHTGSHLAAAEKIYNSEKSQKENPLPVAAGPLLAILSLCATHSLARFPSRKTSTHQLFSAVVLLFRSTKSKKPLSSRAAPSFL